MDADLWRPLALLGLLCGSILLLIGCCLLWALLDHARSSSKSLSHLVCILSAVEHLTETIDKQTLMYARRIGNGHRDPPTTHIEEPG